MNSTSEAYEHWGYHGFKVVFHACFVFLCFNHSSIYWRGSLIWPTVEFGYSWTRMLCSNIWYQPLSSLITRQQKPSSLTW